MTHTVRGTAMAAALAATVTAFAAARVDGQTAREIAARVAGAPDGRVRFTFQSRPTVCGGGSWISTSGDRRQITSDTGRYKNWEYGRNSPDVEWDSTCEHGPVRMVVAVAHHAVTGIRTYVGGRWRPASGQVLDLGAVPAGAAAEYLLSLAQSEPGDVGRQAILPATLADSAVVWPSLLTIARNDRVPGETRRSAVFWLGQSAGDAATAGLTELVASDTLDRRVRESAVFALSQRPRDEGVPALIHIAQTNRDPRIRRRALFWLGQTGDPRALQLFEKLLSGPG